MTKPLRIKFFDEPLLEFQHGQKLVYPRDGLFLYGPVDGAQTLSQIRYGVVSTPEGLSHFKAWSSRVSSFIDIPQPGVRSRAIEPQHVPFPGFRETFGAEWSTEPLVTLAEVDATQLSRALHLANRNEAVKEAVSLFVKPIVNAHDRLEHLPDFWFVVIPEEVYQLGRPLSHVSRDERIPGRVTVSRSRARMLQTQPTLFGEEEEEAEVYKYAVHFRRQLKARLLKHRVVTQLVRETTLDPDAFLQPNGRPIRPIEDRATIAWKLGAACYYKAGGRPWQLADVRPGVCYVGLVYKKDEASSDRRYAVCAAQMFLSNGEGVVFRGALGPWYRTRTKEFHLDHDAASDLVRMVIEEYERIFDGKAPSELFIHARAAFSNEEWAGFNDGVPPGVNVVGVQITDPGDGLKLYRPGEYPIIRGTALLVDDRRAYLWTSGYSPRLDTYMGAETPNPILVRILRGEADLDQVLTDVLGLTKINFNSCLLSDRLPVTIKFANAVGDVLMAAPMEGEPKLPFKYYI